MNSLQDILSEKEKANNFLRQGQYKQAEEAYKKLLEDIDKILKDESITNKNEIIEQKKFIMSNLSMCLFKQNKYEEGMKYDRIIIKKLDKTFAKSYARLIDGYMKCDKFSMARYHYDLMKKNVDQSMIDKFPEIINKLKDLIKTHDQGAEAMISLKGLLNN